MYFYIIYSVGDRGQLLVKSEAMCTLGYHNNTSQSASSFDGGWYVNMLTDICHVITSPIHRFHTGDIVEVVGNRQFKIIDRIKNFFKLSQVCIQVCMNHFHLYLAHRVNLLLLKSWKSSTWRVYL